MVMVEKALLGNGFSTSTDAMLVLQLCVGLFQILTGFPADRTYLRLGAASRLMTEWVIGLAMLMARILSLHIQGR